MGLLRLLNFVPLIRLSFVMIDQVTCSSLDDEQSCSTELSMYLGYIGYMGLCTQAGEGDRLGGLLY